jgi:hypothetical protein
MRSKNKLYLLFVFLFFSICIFFFYKNDVDLKNQVEIKNVSKTLSLENKIDSNQTKPISGISEVSIDKQFHEMSFPDLKNIAPGVTYKTMAEHDFPPDLRNQLMRELEQFKATGSAHGGKVTTEFSNTEDLKENLEKKGIEKLKNGLAFIPIDLGLILGEKYQILGANDQGKFIDGKGWGGFFQIYKDKFSAEMVELSESQLETQVGDGVQAILEFVNYKIAGYNATVESIRSDKGEYIFTIQWFVGERTFNLSTKNLSKQQAIEVAEKITSQFKTLPNGGWKVPYELDVNSLQYLRKQHGTKN